jgi:hypothetical protein
MLASFATATLVHIMGLVASGPHPPSLLGSNVVTSLNAAFTAILSLCGDGIEITAHKSIDEIVGRTVQISP